MPRLPVDRGADAEEMAGVYGSELIVRGRILALAQYIESVQK